VVAEKIAKHGSRIEEVPLYQVESIDELREA